MDSWTSPNLVPSLKPMASPKRCGCYGGSEDIQSGPLTCGEPAVAFTVLRADATSPVYMCAECSERFRRYIKRTAGQVSAGGNEDVV